jgi:hypothetical protein
LTIEVPAALRTAESCIAERRTLWERRLDRLGDYLSSAAGPADAAPASRRPAAPRTQTNDPPKENR